MVWKLFPAIHDENGANHAHPMSTPQSSLQDLITELDVHVELSGLPGSRHNSAADVYFPEIRRSTSSEGSVSHLDVISCWKGLSLAQASELLYWESNFKCSLEQIVTDDFLSLFRDYARYEICHAEDMHSVHSALSMFVRSCTTRVIDVPIPDLITNMMQRFFEENDRSNGRHTWFTSTKDMTSMVFNFVRTRDCFVDGYRFPTLNVDLSYGPPRSGLVSANVHWAIPRVEILDLPSQLQDGSEFRVSPCHHAPMLSEGFCSYPIKASYRANATHGQRHLPMRWNPIEHRFSAIVPRGPSPTRNPVTAMKTILSVNTEQSFPGGVRFQQTTRYRISTKVEHGLSTVNPSPTRYESPWQPSFSNTPMSKLGQPATSQRISNPPVESPTQVQDKCSVDSRVLEQVHARLTNLEIQHARLLSFTLALEQSHSQHCPSSLDCHNPGTESQSLNHLSFNTDTEMFGTHESSSLCSLSEGGNDTSDTFKHKHGQDEVCVHKERTSKLNHLFKKRKASKQLPGANINGHSSAHELHFSVPEKTRVLESAQIIKRQKLIDDTAEVVALPQTTTSAQATISQTTNHAADSSAPAGLKDITTDRSPIMHSRSDELLGLDQEISGHSGASRSLAYGTFDSRVIPALTKNGRVKKMGFPQRRNPRACFTPSPEIEPESESLPAETSQCLHRDMLSRREDAQPSPSRVDTPFDEQSSSIADENGESTHKGSRIAAEMRQYRENYAGYLREVNSRPRFNMGVVGDEEMEKVFLLDSPGNSDWSRQSSSSMGDRTLGLGYDDFRGVGMV